MSIASTVLDRQHGGFRTRLRQLADDLRRSGRTGLALAGMGACLLGSAPAASDDVEFLRIATGGNAGTYYAIGQLIAEGLTGHGGAGCPEGCGLSGVLAVAQLSNGSVANVEAVQQGSVEAGLAQADVVTWAYNAEHVFAGTPGLDRLRVIGSLFSEALHIVVATDSEFRAVGDLTGARVSLGPPGSGTLVDARLVLAAHGIDEADLQARYLKPRAAREAFRAGTLDGFFMVAGYPTPSVRALAAEMPLRLLPVEPGLARSIAHDVPFLRPVRIPADVYDGVAATPTVGVGAQLVVNAEMSAARAYTITEQLWSDHMAGIFRDGHPRGAEIEIGDALAGVGIPLHPGAASWYQRRGLLP